MGIARELLLVADGDGLMHVGSEVIPGTQIQPGRDSTPAAGSTLSEGTFSCRLGLWRQVQTGCPEGIHYWTAPPKLGYIS